MLMDGVRTDFNCTGHWLLELEVKLEFERRLGLTTLTDTLIPNGMALGLHDICDSINDDYCWDIITAV